LDKTKNNSAPEATGIMYLLFKKADPKAEKILYEFAISCIRVRKIPSEWKKGNLYPIPK
ncbi:1698_t:CDS:1, partial [Gigaspora rosea]